MSTLTPSPYSPHHACSSERRDKSPSPEIGNPKQTPRIRLDPDLAIIHPLIINSRRNEAGGKAGGTGQRYSLPDRAARFELRMAACRKPPSSTRSMRYSRGEEVSFAVQAQGSGTEQDPLECLAKWRYVCMPIQIRAFRTCSRISGLAVDFTSRPRMQMADAHLEEVHGSRLANSSLGSSARTFISPGKTSRSQPPSCLGRARTTTLTLVLARSDCSRRRWGSPRSGFICRWSGIYLATGVTFTFWTADSRRERPWTVTRDRDRSEWQLI
jgi:hypothetical protein